jgi:hypothetical protein
VARMEEKKYRILVEIGGGTEGVDVRIIFK